MPVTLREYDPADFETLYDIDRACYPRGIAYSRRVLQWFLAQSGADCLVAESGESLIGFILAEAEGSDGHIITLDVVESHRRTGVGTLLLAEAERRLAARSVNRVSLETATSNEAGVAFWRRHGYRELGVRRRYYLGRLDAFVMRKILAAPEDSH